MSEVPHYTYSVYYEKNIYIFQRTLHQWHCPVPINTSTVIHLTLYPTRPNSQEVDIPNQKNGGGGMGRN